MSGSRNTAPGYAPEGQSFPKRTLFFILLAGLTFRIVHGILTWCDNPLAQTLFSDADYYAVWADKILQGTAGSEAPFWLPPLYPYLLALVRAVFGSLLPVTLFIQAALGLTSLWLIHRITRKQFGDLAALLAALLFLFYAPFCFFETKILVVTLAIPLGLLSIVLLEQGLASGKRSAWALAGLMIGLLCEARPNFLIFAVLALLLALAPTLKRKLELKWKRAAALLIGLCVPFAFSLGYNLAQSGEPVLITVNGGLNFYFGNHKGASGVNDVHLDEFGHVASHRPVSRRLAESETGKPMSDRAVSSHWMSKGIREVIDDPGAWARLFIRKFGLFLSSYEYGVIYLLESERNLSLVMVIQALPAGLILALGGGGLWIALRRKKARLLPLLPLLLFLVSNLLTAVLFFMASRFRLPFMAGLLPFAGYFLAKGVAVIREGHLKGPAWSLIGIGLFTAASFHLIDSEIRTVQYCRAQVSLSKLYSDSGKLKEARDAVRKSMARALTPIAFYQLGVIEEAEGNLIEAVVSYEEAIRLDPRFIDAFTRLADLHEKEKAWEEAIEMRERIISLVPGRFQAYYNLGLTCANAGRMDFALQNLEQAANMAPESPDAWEGLGKAYRLAGKTEKAREALNKAITLDPARASRLEEEFNALDMK